MIVLVQTSFDELYVKLMKQMIQSQEKLLDAQELILALLKERAETGRMYLMNIDHCNSHSSFIDKVEMSNLCQEITLPTKPIQHIDDETGEIALCILSAINIGKIRDLPISKVFVILALGVLTNSLIFKDTPSEQQKSLLRHVDPLVLVSSV